MAQANLYELALSPEDQAAVDAAIDTLVTRLGPHLKNLTTDERKELPKMGAAAGIPNAKAVYDDLAARFPGSARKRGTQPTAA